MRPHRIIARRLILLAFVAAIGFGSRLYPIGNHLWDKSLGDAAWAAAIFLILGILVPTHRRILLAVTAILVALSNEVFKLSGIPSAWSGSGITRVVFGTTFSWQNLICYWIGIGAAGVADALAASMQPK